MKKTKKRLRKKFMKETKWLLLILVLGLMLRLAPIALYEMPLSYDSPFHERHAETILETGVLQKTDESLDSRPNNYPPFYHLLLAELGALSGLDLSFIVMILMPLISVLVILSVYLLVRSFAAEKALLAAFLTAVCSPLIVASYDSPENMIFFFLPIIMLLLLRKKRVLGSMLYAFGLFWNYFAMIMTFIPMYFAFRKDSKTIKFLGAWITAVILFNFLWKGTGFFENQGFLSGMNFILFNLRNALPAVLATGIVFGLPAIYFSFKEKRNEIKFFLCWAGISLIGLASFLASPLFRAWEHLKFLGLSVVVLLCTAGKQKNLEAFIKIFAVAMVITALLSSFLMLFPRVSKNDLQAINFLEQNAENEKILAEPSFSEHIALNSGLGKNLVTSLYYENTLEQSIFAKSLNYLINKNPKDTGFLKENNIEFIIYNFEDSKARGVDWLKEADYWNKIYSLNYKQNCLLDFGLIPAYGCGETETAVLKAN